MLVVVVNKQPDYYIDKHLIAEPKAHYCMQSALHRKYKKWACYFGKLLNMNFGLIYSQLRHKRIKDEHVIYVELVIIFFLACQS